ncbi:exonuclease SbcCD subunit D [Saliterribacillus persicus]|uniref:Nuclease SbcCD subunit D n=1 Tax=Saliterribacillus persicus TaxID=930114 RepID=A0A368XB72_9BACI|nr:exonuclease SbcCD subunit D [Saliterribacillus persicus]RCW64969.1 exodeoxyribonuclease I subunit D [Saliterribacillus persicus]
MRILHTADWHLGKIVNGVHMTDDQAFILDEILQIIDSYQPDIMIIAGDLYDRSIPPKEAVELLSKVITNITVEKRLPLFAISGNHDSPDRLGFGTALFRSQELYMATKIEEALSPIALNEVDGKVEVYLIPYLEPSEVRQYFDDENIKTHQTAMEKIVETIHETKDKNARQIVVAHTFLAGGMETDSEDRLTMIGGTPYVNASIFEEFHYIALGHLHQPQKITQDYIRYSGSILKYSFSEANHQKSVAIVDIDKAGKCEIEKVPLKPIRDMRKIEGYFHDFLDGTTLKPTEDYLHIGLLDDGQLINPIGKLREYYPNILRLERVVKNKDQQTQDINMIRKKQKMSHLQLFQAFYEEMKGDTIPPKRNTYIEKVIDKLHQEERRK